MKKLLLLAGFALFSFIHATAGVETDMPSDSTLTIKKAELKRNDSAIPLKADAKKAVLQKAERAENIRPVKAEAETAIKMEKPVAGKLQTEAKKSASIDELKAASVKNSKIKKAREPEKTPSVSYPYYTGGNVAIREFVRKHQRYPEECKSERLTGRVEVTMTIDWDGTPHSPRITKSSGNEYMDAEALRVADMMPGWNPAEESDDPQGIEYTIFVNFRPGR